MSSIMRILLNNMLYAAFNAPIQDKTRFSQKGFRMEITIFKNFIWGGISLDTGSKSAFYVSL